MGSCGVSLDCLWLYLRWCCSRLFLGYAFGEKQRGQYLRDHRKISGADHEKCNAGLFCDSSGFGRNSVYDRSRSITGQAYPQIPVDEFLAGCGSSILLFSHYLTDRQDHRPTLSDLLHCPDYVAVGITGGILVQDRNPRVDPGQPSSERATIWPLMFVTTPAAPSAASTPLNHR